MSPGPGLHRTILPEGFLASGVNCGVRRYRPDVGLIISEVDAVAAGVFTLNECKAAPVLYCQAILPSPRIRGLITNSGQANAATGDLGVENNAKMVQKVAEELEVDRDQILVASTGVIGAHLAVDKIVDSIPELVERATQVAENFALAILTTDLVPKTVTTTVALSQGNVRITGICKGSGMIHPNMATMLGYLLTDVRLTQEMAQSLLSEATDLSFNMISVDGDCSTNDCNFLLANGASGIGIANDADFSAFRKALIEVSQFLAQSIAADGEGANKLIEVHLIGAPSVEMARRAARGITLSPLIKTAIHGEDPNWGRILARLGAERVPALALGKMSLSLQSTCLYADGNPQSFDRDGLRAKLKQPKINIEIDLKSGTSEATAWGCDLSKRYVEINTEYS